MLVAASEVIPKSVTQAVIVEQSPAITAWATRHDWDIDIDLAGLRLDARTTHPALPGTTVHFCAELDSFTALPPAWTCLDPDDVVGSSAYPAPPQGANPLGASIFHPQPCICAPWNRLAYAVNSGPHSDWALTSWKTAAPGNSHAIQLPEMLSQLHIHLLQSPGMQL